MDLLIVVTFIIGCIVLVLLVINCKKDIYFNSCAYKKESINFSPEFIVAKIEESSDIDGKPIAKYTVRNYFFSKKNNKGFKYQIFYFYDEIGKYSIGQMCFLGGMKFQKDGTVPKSNFDKALEKSEND